MKVVNKSVLVHSCHLEPSELTRVELAIEGRYIEKRNLLQEKDLGKVAPLGQETPDPKSLEGEPSYLILREKCRCRRWITLSDANEFFETGKAMLVWKLRKSALLRDESLIWMPVTRERVPRVDLISRPDIERAFIGSEKISKHFQYNRLRKRFEPIPRPWGVSEKEWLLEARAEIEFEQKFRRRFQNVIDEWFSMYMTERAKWVVDWAELEDKWEKANGSRVDPFLGRQLLAFGTDQRT